MKARELTLIEQNSICPGEAITLTAVLAILVTAIIVVVVYRLMRSSSGSAKLPGGWQFSWK